LAKDKRWDNKKIKIDLKNLHPSNLSNLVNGKNSTNVLQNITKEIDFDEILNQLITIDQIVSKKIYVL